MTELKPFLEDMLSMSTGVDGRTLQIHFCRPVTADDRKAIMDAHNAACRPAPVAPVSPDATGKCGELDYYTASDVMWSLEGHDPKPSKMGQWVKRSQAVELLAAERAEKEELEKKLSGARTLIAAGQIALSDNKKLKADNAAKDDECKYLKSTLSAWFDTKKITEDSLKPLMVAAVKGYLRTCSSGGMPQELIDEVLPAVECMIDYGVFAESVTQYTMSLKADNAALTARVEELETRLEFDPGGGDRIDALESALGFSKHRNEALEAKLAAAEKALEPFARLEIPPKPQGNAGAYSVRHKDILEARAALRGKPS